MDHESKGECKLATPFETTQQGVATPPTLGTPDSQYTLSIFLAAPSWTPQ